MIKQLPKSLYFTTTRERVFFRHNNILKKCLSVFSKCNDFIKNRFERSFLYIQPTPNEHLRATFGKCRTVSAYFLLFLEARLKDCSTFSKSLNFLFLFDFFHLWNILHKKTKKKAKFNYQTVSCKFKFKHFYTEAVNKVLRRYAELLTWTKRRWCVWSTSADAISHFLFLVLADCNRKMFSRTLSIFFFLDLFKVF